MSTEGDTNITIVGAGLAGGLLACLLGEAGYQVDVYERRSDPRAKGFIGGRSINLAVSTRGIHALRQAGLADKVLEDAIRMPGRMIHSTTGELSFQPYSKNADDAINSVSRGGLNLTLLNAADGHSNVNLHFEHRCVDVDLDRPSATFAVGENGESQEVESSIIIGCDGAFSAVRGPMQILDRFSYRQEYLEHGYKELVIPPTADGEFAMEPNALHIWPRGGYMMIALPNKDRTFTCTIFWPFKGPHSFEAVAGESDVRSFFETHFPDAVPLMPTLVEDYRQNPTSSLATIRCDPWHHRDKVLLLGDAAHAIVPFYGQGINAGFEDCTVFMDCVSMHRGNWASIFATTFERRKRHSDAIADMALANFIEMRDHTGSRAFRLKKRTERTLHRYVPQWYTPLYNMVTFSRIPYAEAREKARRQDQVVRRVLLGVLVLVLIAIVFVLGMVLG